MLIVKETYRREGIIVLSLDRPERLNALNDKMIAELDKALDQIEKEDDVKIVIVMSESEKAFCSGVDVAYVQSLSNEEAAKFFVKVADFLERLKTFRKTTIAVVDGYAFGGGADIAIACDIRIGSEASSFRFPGPQFGLILGTERLVAEIGASRARFLTLTNERIDAEQALQYGLLHEVTGSDELLDRAFMRGKKLVQLSSNTVSSLKKLTDGTKSHIPPREWTYKSVLDGNFQERFTTYIEQMKKNK